ncbi:MAG: hypothetical protein ACKO3H_11275 [Verrucomicrobiota bacterium]
MNLRPILPLCAVAILAASGCQTQAPTEYVLQLTSATPVGYSGVLIADGKRQEIQGKTPGEFRVTAKDLSWKIRQSTEQGTLTLEVKDVKRPERIETVVASTGPNSALVGGTLIKPGMPVWPGL